MRIYNSVGCSIDGISEEEFLKFEKQGWMTEKDYIRDYVEEQGDEE